MNEWTNKDEAELVEYEAELKKQETVAKNATYMVGGVFFVALVGLITLVVLIVV